MPSRKPKRKSLTPPCCKAFRDEFHRGIILFSVERGLESLEIRPKRRKWFENDGSVRAGIIPGTRLSFRNVEVGEIQWFAEIVDNRVLKLISLIEIISLHSSMHKDLAPRMGCASSWSSRWCNSGVLVCIGPPPKDHWGVASSTSNVFLCR